MIAALAPAPTVSPLRPAGAPVAAESGFDAVMTALAMPVADVVAPATVTPPPSPVVPVAGGEWAVPGRDTVYADEAACDDAIVGEAAEDDSAVADETVAPAVASPAMAVPVTTAAVVPLPAAVVPAEAAAAAPGGSMATDVVTATALEPVTGRAAALATFAAGTSAGAIARTSVLRADEAPEDGSRAAAPGGVAAEAGARALAPGETRRADVSSASDASSPPERPAGGEVSIATRGRLDLRDSSGAAPAIATTPTTAVPLSGVPSPQPRPVALPAPAMVPAGAPRPVDVTSGADARNPLSAPDQARIPRLVEAQDPLDASNPARPAGVTMPPATGGRLPVAGPGAVPVDPLMSASMAADSLAATAGGIEPVARAPIAPAPDGDGVVRAGDGAALKAAVAGRGGHPVPAGPEKAVEIVADGRAHSVTWPITARMDAATSGAASSRGGASHAIPAEAAAVAAVAPAPVWDMPIDLAAIFPLRGNAPLAVSFVRPQAGGVEASPWTAADAGEGAAVAGVDGADGAALAAPVVPAALPVMPAVAPAVDRGIVAVPVAASPEMPIEHHLKAAHDGAWLDRLAGDIAASADPGSPVRFALNGERLGAVKVEIDRRDDGAALRFTTDSEAARTLIADAQPALAAEARTHGVRIADAKVDVAAQGSGPATGGQGSPQGQSGGMAGSAQQQQHQAGGQRAAAFERPVRPGARSGSAGQVDRPAARAERYA